MTNKNKALLEAWLARFKEIEAAYDAAKKVLGCQPDSPLIAAMYKTFDDYTKMLAIVVGDNDEWLQWFLWENQAGKRGHAAKSEHMEKEKPIRTIDNLCELLYPKSKESGSSQRR